MPEDTEIARWEGEGGLPEPLRTDEPVTLTFPLGQYGSITVKGVGPAIVEVRS